MTLSIDLSGGIAKKLGLKKKQLAKLEARIAGAINAGLAEMAKKHPAARALLASEQTVRVVCFGSKEADKAGLKQKPGLMSMFTGPGATKGDFTKSGRPRKGGPSW